MDQVQNWSEITFLEVHFHSSWDWCLISIFPLERCSIVKAGFLCNVDQKSGKPKESSCEKTYFLPCPQKQRKRYLVVPRKPFFSLLSHCEWNSSSSIFRPPFQPSLRGNARNCRYADDHAGSSAPGGSTTATNTWTTYTCTCNYESLHNTRKRAHLHTIFNWNTKTLFVITFIYMLVAVSVLTCVMSQDAPCTLVVYSHFSLQCKSKIIL